MFVYIYIYIYIYIPVVFGISYVGKYREILN